MNIPLIDYRRSFGQYREFTGEKIAEAVASSEFILKGSVRELEGAISRLTGATCAVATSSATNGLLLALHALGVGQGTEVLTPAFGFPSPLNCVINLGARPVLVDVERESGVLDPEMLEEKLTPRTRVILPMHLGRALADMPRIRQFAQAHDLTVVEDSAVALGAQIAGRDAGRWGRAGVFSFYQSKPLAGIGDGGMLISDDEALAQRCRRLRNHGQNEGKRFIYEETGWNSRMDEIAAGFLTMKLEGFESSLRRRREIAAFYDQSFTVLQGRLSQVVSKNVGNGHHLYVVQTAERAGLQAHLLANGIETQFFHPTPLHLHPGFAQLMYRAGDFPAAEWLAQRTLALPCFPELEDDEVDYIARKVVEFYAR